MAVPKMTTDQRDQWRRLFTLAERLDQIDPWQWMGPADCFGVAVPGWGEPCFVLFGGEPKAFRHVRFLLGWKPFYDLVSRLAAPEKQVATWLLEIRMIELLFVSEDLLFEHEQSFLKRLRRRPGAGYTTPVFRSIMPGYHPWFPDERELSLLEPALYQAFGMAMRVEADSGLLKSRFPGEILLRKQDAKGGWSDVWEKVKEVGDEEVEVRIETKRLDALLKLPMQPVTLQLDLVFTPLKILPDGKRPQTAYVLLAVDAKSGFILAGDLLQATEGVAHMWAQIPERLLEIFEQLGGCPEAIEIGTDRMANLLRPLSEHLPFRMVRREKLSMLESARENLSSFILKQGKPGRKGSSGAAGA
jgi:hypothetical protein